MKPPKKNTWFESLEELIKFLMKWYENILKLQSPQIKEFRKKLSMKKIQKISLDEQKKMFVAMW